MSRVRSRRTIAVLLVSLAAGMGVIDGSILAFANSQSRLAAIDSQPSATVLQPAGNQTKGAYPSWDSEGLWNPSNVDNSTVTFPSNTIARFTNFQYSWPPAVSIASKENWTVQSRLVLLERVRAWNFTSASGSYAWQTALDWGSGSAAMGYGTDNTHSPATGVLVGGECFLGTLTTANLVGQWVTVNITLSAPTQTIYFSIYGSNGGLLGQASTQGLCGTMFGTLPIRALFFTSFGITDVDWISVTGGNSVVLFDDFLNGQPRLLVSSSPYSWTFDDRNTTGWTPIVGWNSAAGRPEYPQSCGVVTGEYSLTTCEPLYRSRNFTDFTFEAQVRVVNATGTPIWGIGFRENRARPAYANITKTTGDPYTLPQGYSFEFIGSNAYLYKCEESPSIVCSVLASAFSNRTNIYAENTLRVVAMGSDIQLFLNGAKIMEAHDSRFPQGLVELFSIPNGCNASGCASVTSNFDNVAIIPANKPRPSFNQTLTFHQVTVNASGYFIDNPNTTTITGIINVVAVNTTTSQLLLAKTFNITIVSPQNGTVRFILVIPDKPADLGLHCGVNLNTNETNCSLSRNPDVAHRGQVDIVDFGMIAYNFNTIKGSPGYNPALDLAGDGTVDIISVGIAAIEYNAQVFS